MGAGVVEGVEMTLRIGNAYVRSGDIEDKHLAIFDVLWATNSHRHVCHLHFRQR
jgi:hypothetical protein